MTVNQWSDVPIPDIVAHNPIAYDKDDEDETRQEVDLYTYPTYDLFGDEIPVYTQDGHKILRRRAEDADPCGNLLDLASVHTLFERAPDAYGVAANAVPFSVYPLAFTRSLGNVQADGFIMPFKHRFNLLNTKIQEQINTVDEEDEPSLLPPGAEIIHPVCAQMYNALSHRVRNEAKFHSVQLGLLTSIFSGTTVETAVMKSLWSRRFRMCTNALP